MKYASDFLVVGAGIFGLMTALELNERGYQVTLIDPGPVPHPLAASTDISKVVRMEYGNDLQYMQMVDQAIDGWHQLNSELGAPLYHETGVAMLTRAKMQPGGYQYESFQLLLQQKVAVERLDVEALRRRFPAWNAEIFVDGFFNRRGGYVESGRVIAALLQMARQSGVDVYLGQTARHLIQIDHAVAGVVTDEGDRFRADHTIVAAGQWTPRLIRELRQHIKTTGHPVFHLRPVAPDSFMPPHFVVWTADIAQSGWYGFPLHPHTGVIKLANHGVGVEIDVDSGERVVYPDDIASMRRFVSDALPALAEAELVYTRRCVYTDTLDEHLWIDHHPDLERLTVATGGSGHGFKFGPVLGKLIADVAEDTPNRWAARFRWRNLSPATLGEEASRFHAALR